MCECVCGGSVLLSHVADDMASMTCHVDRQLLRDTVQVFAVTNDKLTRTAMSSAQDKADVQLAANSCQVTCTLVEIYLSLSLSLYVSVCLVLSLYAHMLIESNNTGISPSINHGPFLLFHKGFLSVFQWPFFQLQLHLG